MTYSFITPRLKHEKKGDYFKYIIEKDYIDYFKKFKISLIPLTYNKEDIDDIFKKKIKVIVFSGGNDLYSKSKTKENKIRDSFEKYLLKKCLKKKISVIAICRGFQLVSEFFKGSLIKTNSHLVKSHKILLKKNTLSVNSFHRYKITKVNKCFNILGVAEDKSIEYAYIKKYNILCTMFHPERKNKDQAKINNIIRKFLK